MSKTRIDKNSKVAEEAMTRMGVAVESDRYNRAAMLEDLRFSHGDQWPAEIKMQRQLDKRPCLTINKTDSFIRNVINNMRQQRPRIKVHPVADGADQRIAEVIEGLFRHIEVQSNADVAYDTAAEAQVRMGIGYVRVAARYCDERSFDQDLYIDQVRNPFSVYLDPSSTQPDGLDAQWCIITDRIRKDEFKRLYPGALLQDFTASGDGDNQDAWSTREETLIAEYWRIEFHPDKLLKLSDGRTLFSAECGGADTIGQPVDDALVVDVRDSMRKVVLWSKITKTQELEKREWPGKYIPVIPVYGAEQLENGRLMRYGMVRNMKDPQRMYNFWRPLSLDTPVPTPSGWTLMRDLHAGDVVFDENGNPVNVLGESPVHINRACYKIVFGDGTEVISDGEHPWTVETRGARASKSYGWLKEDVTTADLVPGKHFIAVAKPLQMPNSDLPVDPYLLGAWLGDGYSSEPAICQHEDDIDELRFILESRGVELWPIRTHKGRIPSFQIKGVRSKFTKLGLLDNKHIPEQYLRASEEQRWALLQGLMDTDGSVSKMGLCSFTNTNQRIADGFAELIRSLGFKCAVIKRTGRIRMWANGNVSEHADAWQFSFSAHSDQPVFALSRKVSKLPDASIRCARRARRHGIKSVERVASVPVKCIAVDTPTHLFLCGAGMIPTHNTQETEFVALAPKAPWLIAEGQIDNHQDEWATANIKNHSTLTYRPVSDENGQMVPPPTRLQPQAVPAASINAAMSASEDLKAVAGMFDPALGAPGQETSGVMVQRRQSQSDMSNYHFYDNLTRSIRAVGIVMLDLVKTYYTGERIVRIIGEDGNPDTAALNAQQADRITNDLGVGRYDVVMETGPGYNTKREDSVDSMLALVQHWPQLAQIAGDLIVGQMDWPGATSLAERLKMANPLAGIQDQIPKELDPKAQAIVGQLMGQLQQTKQQLQMLQQEKAAKVMGVQEREQAVTERDSMKEFAETHRLHIKEQGEMQRAELAARTKMHDVQSRDNTSMHETILDNHTDLEIARRASLDRGKPNPGV